MDIIELRQLDSDNINNNGDYMSILNEPLVLMPGDGLAVRNCFVDTKNINDAEIVLNSDYTFEVSTVKGFRNSFGYDNGANLVLSIYEPYNGLVGDTNDWFIECYESNITTGYVQVNYVEYEGTSFGELKQNPYPFQYSYIDVNGKQQTITINQNMDKVDNGVKYNVNINVVAKKNTFTLLHQDKKTLKKNARSKFIGINETDYTNAKIYKARTNDFSFTIPAGNYTLQRFQEEFNLRITKLVLDDSTGQLKDDGPLIGITYEDSIVTNRSHPFCNVHGDKGFLRFITNKPGNKQFLFGTNQMAIEFDTTLQMWKMLNHFSFYDKNNIVCRFSDLEPVGQYGATFLTHLGCKDANGTVINFFQDVLGFDLSKLLCEIVYYDTTFSGSDVTFPKFKTPVVDGQNVSNVFMGVDVLVNKSEEPKYNDPMSTDAFFIIDTSNLSSYTAITNDFNYIISSKKYNELKLNPYYYIELDIVNNNFYSEGFKSHKIAGIVGGYYAVGSYLTAGPESSISYINDGLQPIIFSSVNVRILGTDKELISDLGEDNTIILEVVKTQKK